jgi:hypothetical protein
VVAAVAVSVAVGLGAAVATIGGDSDDDLGAAGPATTGSSTTTSASSGGGRTTTSSTPTSAERSTTTTGPPPPPTALPATGPVAIDEARLDALSLPDGTCDGWVADEVSRTLVGGRSDGGSFQSIELVDWAAGDLDGDGVPDAVARISCATGGSGEAYEAVAVLAAGGVVRIDYGAHVPSRWELDLWVPEITAGRLVLRVGSSTEHDAHCCSSIDTELTFALDGAAFGLVGSRTQDAGSMTRQLAALVDAGDEAAIAGITTPQVGAVVAASRAQGGDLAVDEPPTCRRLPDVDRVACVLRAADGSSIEVGWRADGFFVRVADVVVTAGEG